DSKREKLIKGRMKRLQPERALRQQVPVESFHVSNIKNNAVPLGNRPIVKRIFPHDAKHLVGARARVYQSGVKAMPDADSTGCGSHSFSPPIGCGCCERDT